jgi:hypothetical protein
LVSNDTAGEGSSIYKSDPNDPCRILSTGARLGISYTVLARLKKGLQQGSASSSLGSILVDWRPSFLELPSEGGALSRDLGIIKAHGPLALATPSTIRFTGPRCYIERAPFEAKAVTIPSSLTVATPFEVQYRVTNKTSMHQLVRIQVREANSSSGGGSASESGLFLSGCTKGELSLGPSEQQIVSFTAIATRPGDLTLPALLVSSDRYQSWIMNDGSSWKRCYVLP